jgi:hypothetical protein
VKGRRAVDSRGVRRRLWRRRGSLQLTHVALELCLGDAAAAADVDGTQIPALHEGVHSRATDAEDLRGLFGREEEPIGGRDVSERLRITHVDLSQISRALLRGGCRTTVGERSAADLQFLSSQTNVAVRGGLETRAAGCCRLEKFRSLGFSAHRGRR